MKTKGISPKVSIPALASIALGVVLLLLGLDVEGRTLIAAGLGVGALGGAAKPGNVVPKQRRGRG